MYPISTAYSYKTFCNCLRPLKSRLFTVPTGTSIISAMSAYPYPPSEAYPDDEMHREYLKRYNTRRLGPGSPPRPMVP